MNDDLRTKLRAEYAKMEPESLEQVVELDAQPQLDVNPYASPTKDSQDDFLKRLNARDKNFQLGGAIVGMHAGIFGAYVWSQMGLRSLLAYSSALVLGALSGAKVGYDVGTNSSIDALTNKILEAKGRCDVESKRTYKILYSGLGFLFGASTPIIAEISGVNGSPTFPDFLKKVLRLGVEFGLLGLLSGYYADKKKALTDQYLDLPQQSQEGQEK